MEIVPPFGGPSKPSVTCGLTVFPGDARLDSKMTRQIPRGNFTMRVPTPTICQGPDRDPHVAISKGLSLRLPQIVGPKR
jgi:hypothetical protein